MAEETRDTEIPEDNAMQTRIAQLERGIASKDSELAATRDALTGAVAKYRTALLASSPGIPQELVKGETVEEIDASLKLAQDIVARVKQQLETEVEENKVPTGAPPRAVQDLSALSPAEKIAYALRKS